MKVQQLENEVSDVFIDRVARVSFDGMEKPRTPEEVTRLTKFLVRENHWTPLAHGMLTLVCHEKVLPVEDILQSRRLLAGLHFYRDRNTWRITGSLWGFLQLGSFLGLKEIFDVLEGKAPVAVAAFMDKHNLAPATTDKRLFHYGETPSHHQWATFLIEVPFPIRTQIFKHKDGFVENEVSRRYVNSTPELFDLDGWRSKPSNAKQGSGRQMYLSGWNEALTWLADYLAVASYNRLIRLGVCAEQARFKLPQGAMTKFIWTGTKESYDRFFGLRIKPDAQLEVKLVAQQIAKTIHYESQKL